MGLSQDGGRVSRTASAHAIPESWALKDVLLENPGFALVPGRHEGVVIAGDFRFVGSAPGRPEIEDAYSIELQIPRTYPSAGFPQLFETAGRIPPNYHTNPDRSLCLGSPTRLRAIVLRNPRIDTFIKAAVVPFLYGRSHFERYGFMPFGELAHGNDGLTKDFVALMRMPAGTDVKRLLVLASMRRRQANKLGCACGSGQRLGSCHNLSVNAARTEFGRRWFAEQSMQIFGGIAR